MKPTFEDVFSPLSEADWNFDLVPEREIIACCLWEYARESKTIGMAADEHWCIVRDIQNRERYKSEPEIKLAHDEEAARIRRRLKAVGFNYEEFSNKFWESDLAAIEIYHSLKNHVMDGASAWREIPMESRCEFSDQISKSFSMYPLIPAMVGELEKLWNANRRDLDERRSKPRPDYDDSEDGALYQISEHVILEGEAGKPSAGSFVTAFTVDFARFNNREIQAAFEQWLIANRPKQWQRPLRVFPSSSARGKKQIEYRVALERLGLMRLLHWHTPSEIRKKYPNAWKKYRRKKDSFRRELREVGKFLHKAFPFLPAGERPSSEVRLGVWFPEMMAACDKIESEMEQMGDKK